MESFEPSKKSDDHNEIVFELEDATPPLFVDELSRLADELFVELDKQESKVTTD